jgi:hypothetical protein
MKHLTRKTCTGATLAFSLIAHSVAAFAGAAVVFDAQRAPVSEPETLALLAVGAVAVIVARWSKRK